MKWLLLFLSLTVLSCSEGEKGRRSAFPERAVDVATTGSLKQLTDDNRSIYPVFGPGDTIVFYQRLLITDPQDTIGYFREEWVKPYGIHFESGELYTLSAAREFPSQRQLDPSSIAPEYANDAVFAIQSPDSNVYAFETVTGDDGNHTIFLSSDGFIKQLSDGETHYYLDRFSDTGRYLTAIRGKGPTWVVIYDLQKQRAFRIPHGDTATIDYLTSFSSDDARMLFIRTDRKYSWGRDYFGDIWLYTFGNTIIYSPEN
jgi:hypothetical protein